MLKQCSTCNKDFEARRVNTLYCSTKCRNKASYARKPKLARPIWETMSVEELFCKFATPWTLEQKHLYDIDRKAFEGKGEKSRRHCLGLPLFAQNGPIDIPEEGEEIKGLDSHDAEGKYRLTANIRLGQSLEETSFGDAFELVVLATRMVEEGHDLITDPDVLRDFKRLAIKTETLDKIPEPHRQRVIDLFRFSKVMGHAKWLTLVSENFGWLRIPSSDFDKAFVFVSTSQSRLNYRFDWNYLRDKVRISHEQEKDRNDIVRMLCGEEHRGQSPHPVGSTVPGQGLLGDSEGSHQRGRDGGGLRPEGDQGGSGNRGEIGPKDEPSEVCVSEREEDCCLVFIDPREWRSEAS